MGMHLNVREIKTALAVIMSKQKIQSVLTDRVLRSRAFWPHSEEREAATPGRDAELHEQPK